MLEYVKLKSTEVVPILVELCITFIESNITTGGIFRIPGPRKKCELSILKCLIGYNIDFQGKDGGIHCACSILKQYFREVPRRLLGTELLKYVLEKNSDWTIDSIPDLQSVIFKYTEIIDVQLYGYLFKFLGKVHEKSSENMMSSANLSIVWAPNFVTDVKLLGSQKIQLFTKFLIENAVQIFSN